MIWSVFIDLYEICPIELRMIKVYLIKKGLLVFLVTLQLFIFSYFAAVGLQRHASANQENITHTQRYLSLSEEEFGPVSQVIIPVSISASGTIPSPSKTVVKVAHTTPIPTSVQPKKWTQEQIKRRICEVFGSQCRNALTIAYYESKYDQFAFSHTDDYGVMQVNCYWHKAKVGGDCNKLFDVETNLKVAKQIYDASGWRAWSTYKYL